MHKRLLLMAVLLMIGTYTYADFLGPFTAGEVAPVLVRLRASRADTTRAKLLIQLSDLYFYRAGRSARDLDSAYYYTSAAHKLAASLGFDDGLAEVYFQEGAILPMIDQREKGRHATEMAAKLFTKQHNYRMMGESYYRLAGYYGLTETEIGDRIKFTHSSLDAFRLAKLPVKVGAVLQTLGDLHSSRGENGPALTYLKESLQAYQSAKYDRLMGVYNLLGNVYTALGVTDEGIKYGILAVRNAQALGDTSMQLATIYNHLGLTYYTLREYPKAIVSYDNSLRIAEKYKDAETIYIVAANKAYPYIKLKKFAEAARFLREMERKYPMQDIRKKLWLDRAYMSVYRELRQFSKATKYINELMTLIDQGIAPEETELIYSHLVEFYFAKKDYSLAEKYLALKRKIKLDNLRVLHRSHLWQARLDSVNHQYFSALSEFQKYSVLMDSFYNETKSRQINQLEVIYETEMKEENIQALRKESVLHQQMLRQASLVQNITFVSIALLLTIVGLLIYGNLLVKKNNKALAASQQEINNKNISLGRLVSEKQWLMKEIHHRVKNNLHMIVGLLESQAEFLTGDEAKMALAESEHRIQSMSMIHQKLYQTENLTSIEISPYIHELVQYLKACFKGENPVEFNLEIEQADMNISHAIPLGLILNEAIINALKYAFPPKTAGRIDVILKQTSPGYFLLKVSDNGVGLKPGFDINQVNSFGLTLILGLCQDLGGQAEVISDGGTTIRIAFAYTTGQSHTEQYANLPHP
ncbi:Two-component sensor histidine kinase, contains HisKA and HATPase domains [Dyadobacter soli]|uniref:histidine kinase n=1 Tax=Dyadobacter soli TaxID=659014 RepID=A0A1G8C604_9BACT|nr:histidine kinase dimerization/phosphoacceptor domain -containing protein [Dyadobacter soli]SDH40768.1 Two-component sensor histidine kinase, contains HisKA and HATPase domains [Dyadobacter soli]